MRFGMKGKPSRLMARLALHELDLVLSDFPMGPQFTLNAFSHILGEAVYRVRCTGTCKKIWKAISSIFGRSSFPPSHRKYKGTRVNAAVMPGKSKQKTSRFTPEREKYTLKVALQFPHCSHQM